MDDVEPHSLFDMPSDEAAEAEADTAAIAEIKAGNGVPHEHVREWFMKLAKGEKVPPPTA